MKTLSQQLITLAETQAKFENVSHWAISMRLLKKGDFFKGLMSGKGCSTRTYERLIGAFDVTWPEDLEWPEDVPRPQKKRGAA